MKRRPEVRLRLPRREELVALSELCLRSKAVHGYSAAMLAAFREELIVSEEEIIRDAVIVAEADGVAVGLAQVSMDEEGCYLEKLFVEPDLIGHGVGRLLMDWAVVAARSVGADEMVIEADPGAAEFYTRYGAKPAGEVPSGSVPGRSLPRLVLPLAQTGEPGA